MPRDTVHLKSITPRRIVILQLICSLHYDREGLESVEIRVLCSIYLLLAAKEIRQKQPWAPSDVNAIDKREVLCPKVKSAFLRGSEKDWFRLDNSRHGANYHLPFTQDHIQDWSEYAESRQTGLGEILSVDCFTVIRELVRNHNEITICPKWMNLSKHIPSLQHFIPKAFQGDIEIIKSPSMSYCQMHSIKHSIYVDYIAQIL